MTNSERNEELKEGIQLSEIRDVLAGLSCVDICFFSPERKMLKIKNFLLAREAGKNFRVNIDLDYFFETDRPTKEEEK